MLTFVKPITKRKNEIWVLSPDLWRVSARRVGGQYSFFADRNNLRYTVNWTVQ